MLAAAQVNLQAGAFDAALGLLAAAQAGPLDELGRARVDLLHAEVAYAQNRGSDAPPLLLRAAKDARDARRAALARHLSRRLERGAVRRAPGASAGSLLEVSRAVRTAPDRRALAAPGDLLLDGFALVFTEGRVRRRRRCCSALRRRSPVRDVSVEEVLRWGWLATAAAVFVWDFDTCLAVATREVQLARESGALEVLAVGVNVLGQAVALGGDFASAAAAGRRGRRGHGGHRHPRRPVRRARARRVPRPEAEASELIEATIREATAGGQGTAVQYAHWANAVLMNGLGRYEEALAAAIAGERRHAGAVRRHVGAQRADRGRQSDAGHRARGDGARSDWASRHGRATPSGRSASRRGHARC